MLLAFLLIISCVCAIQAFRARRLIHSALYLAGVSATLALIFYLLGAETVAVIELSVGAGLVTVLFAFAISLAGEEAMIAPTFIPRPLAFMIALVPAVIIGLQILPALRLPIATAEAPFAEIFWNARGADALVQVVLIFAGILGLLGLLSRDPATPSITLQKKSNIVRPITPAQNRNEE